MDSSLKEIFETRVMNLEPREDRKKPSVSSKKKVKEKKYNKKRKRENSNSNAVESRKESSLDYLTIYFYISYKKIYPPEYIWKIAH